MITKSELQKYRDLLKEKEDLQERILRKESAIKSAAVQVITGMPRAESGDSDKIARAVAQIEKLKELYERKLVEIENELARIESEIERLEPFERRLVRHRYIDGYSWEKICVKLNYSWATLHRMHANILLKLKDDTQ